MQLILLGYFTNEIIKTKIYGNKLLFKFLSSENDVDYEASQTATQLYMVDAILTKAIHDETLDFYLDKPLNKLDLPLLVDALSKLVVRYQKELFPKFPRADIR